ncbi:hypothetical protein BIFPSEUDO_03146 [Bifidobacterium pseudocatenulatum DSM 20438 = JCM 1200 = LMG 10505]|uniref:Uncharacterized protein n=1 Tax=Bifidobacterium pseudocatenulatum DSM 20438 = JCM 1200 = LMG 10505 TaxID=547043 RepID=C0BSM7_BIFPS|nr:hypothetical protein BIFPSEUDO_03146 [Bifidobacterium pseudocatenulatum DSM 20438 = JCM 1200 = LMG 10505]
MNYRQRNFISVSAKTAGCRDNLFTARSRPLWPSLYGLKQIIAASCS